MEYLVVKNGPNGSHDVFVSVSDVADLVRSKITNPNGTALASELDNIKSYGLLSKGADFIGEVDLKK